MRLSEADCGEPRVGHGFMGGATSVLTGDASTQTSPDDVTADYVTGRYHGDDIKRPSSGATAAVAAAVRVGGMGRKKEETLDPSQILQAFSAAQIKEMVTLYQERQEAIDRSSIKCTVQAKRDLFNSLSTEPIKPRLDHTLLHRQNHPKGYLTKITTDYEAKHDEEITVHKGTMVKVLRNHKDGRYEVYTAGGFGLVPGKVLAYIQYEPDYT